MAMRISTNTIFDQGVAQMQRRQAELINTQQQMSLGTRIVTPSDDPVAAARVLLVDQAAATNTQYGVNRGAARSALGLEESVLASVGDLIQQVRTSAVYAGNPSLTDSDRTALATDLNSRFQQLLGLANTTDGTGLYLFSGYQGSTQPYSGAAGAVTYHGDQGQRLIQAGPVRQIAVSDSGTDVFDRAKTGNGAFQATAAGTNTGTGVIGAGSVVDASALTGHAYQITFSVTGGTTTYDVLDTTAGTAVATAQPYTAGSTITFGGMQIQIDGAPADADAFDLVPSSSQSVFKTLSDLIAAVSAPISDGAGHAKLSNAVNVAIANLDQALDRVLSVRADVGARMNELDSLDTLGSDMALQYSKTTSALKDLDYTKAASDLSQQQLVLQAAQKSFTMVATLSLFDLL